MPALPSRGTTPGPPNLILDPTGTTTSRQAAKPKAPRARRPASLEGATVGLLVNTKQNTFTRILPSPRHVPLVVAGARNAAISMVVRVFGEWSGTASPVQPLPAARERPAVPLGLRS